MAAVIHIWMYSLLLEVGDGSCPINNHQLQLLTIICSVGLNLALLGMLHHPDALVTQGV